MIDEIAFFFFLDVKIFYFIMFAYQSGAKTLGFMGSGVDRKLKYNYPIFIIFFSLKKIPTSEHDDNRD